MPLVFRACEIRMRNAAELGAAIDARRRTVAEEVRALAAACVAKGLVPAAALEGWQPAVEFDVIDVRSDQRVALPLVR